METAVDEKAIQEKYELLSDILNERGRRLWATVEAKHLGRGGVLRVAQATGLSRTTIYQGLGELADRQEVGSLRRVGVRRMAAAATAIGSSSGKWLYRLWPTKPGS